jgi:hypothetical protein
MRCDDGWLLSTNLRWLDTFGTRKIDIVTLTTINSLRRLYEAETAS